MLIYDRDDPELSEPVNMEMSEEVKASWGHLISENEDATAKALVCNLPHLQLLLELMNANHEPPAELLSSMLSMAVPFFFSVVVRLGASKPPVYSYSSAMGSSSYYNSGTMSGFGSSISYGTGVTTYSNTMNKPLEAEENEELDELLWQWGYMLGTLIGQSSEADIVKLLEEHKKQLTGALLSCPRESTRKSISRMLLRIAAVGTNQALLVYHTLIAMLPSCSKTAPNDQLECYSATLRRLMQISEVREFARSHEGVARILNSWVTQTPLTLTDFNDINLTDPAGGECARPMGSHAGLGIKPNCAELGVAVCELLSPVDELPPVSAKMIGTASVLRDLQNHGSARGKVHLLSAGILTGGETAAKKLISDTITDLTPSYVNTHNAVKQRTARDTIPALLTPEYGDTLMEALVRKAVELANPPANTYAAMKQQKAKLAAGVLELILEMSGNEIAYNWMQNNRNVWEAVASGVHMSDATHRAALDRLLHGEGAENAGVENAEDALVSTVYEQLKAHGEYFDNKQHWCQKAIHMLGAGCDAATAANWVMSHEVELSRADRSDNGLIQGADGEVGAGFEEVDVADLIDSWQADCSDKLFKAAENGDNKLEKMERLIYRGADVNSTHLSGRTPLHNAARNNQADAVKLLLDHGANVNCDTDGWTPLHNACNFHKPNGYPNCLPSIRNLLQGNADINLQISPGQGWAGKTPLDLCTDRNKKDAEELLRRYM
jgi:hypothetical protein